MFGFLKRLFSASKEVSFTLSLMDVIQRSLETADITNALGSGSVVPEVAYGLLPSKWKAPNGPVTEAEFRLVLRLGLDFYQAIQTLFKKN